MSQELKVEQRSLQCAILGLPAELLCEHILSHLTATSLAFVEMSCRFFRVGLFSWKQRLWFEESLADFDVDLLSRAGISRSFSLPDCKGAISKVSMQNQLGPKLLVSSLTTHDRPVLKWRLRVTGNAAVEFGVVPSSLAAAVNEGCIVEIEARSNHVHYLITNPPAMRHPACKHNGYALQAGCDDEAQQDSCSVPREMRLQHAIFPDCAYRLAATCWANAQLEVIPRFATHFGANMQDPSLDSCFDSGHQAQSGHMNTAIVMPGGSVSQTGHM
ncbi:MAG: hypothetical protein FRX49_11139 [Trebouxia sp. A1-2]|nr:MAG: hypothetical protein FRX49_11139 [Trebouxia sp. A1-2]